MHIRETLFETNEVCVDASCENLDRQYVSLEVDAYWSDGTAVIAFCTIDDMIQFADDVKDWATRLKHLRGGV